MKLGFLCLCYQSFVPQEYPCYPIQFCARRVIQGQRGLQATAFVMAYRKGETGGAHNLAKATRQATLKFFTKRRCAPRGWTGPRPKLETHLLRKFSNGVEACQCGLSMAGLSLTDYDCL